MNKSQELAVQQLRAKKNVQELLKQHQASWHGQEPKMIEDVKKVSQELPEGGVEAERKSNRTG